MIQRVSLAGRGLPALVLAAATAACTSMPDPDLGLPKVAGFVQADPVEAVVLIDRKCHASPEVAVIEVAAEGPVRTQVVWVAAKNAGETLRITPKGSAAQDRWNRERGRSIRALFGAGFESGAGGENAIRSGPPTLGRELLRNGAVRWRYDVEIVGANGAKVCSRDPVVCIRDSGSPGCDYNY
jgi:hypothetical protein